MRPRLGPLAALLFSFLPALARAGCNPVFFAPVDGRLPFAVVAFAVLAPGLTALAFALVLVKALVAGREDPAPPEGPARNDLQDSGATETDGSAGLKALVGLGLWVLAGLVSQGFGI